MKQTYYVFEYAKVSHDKIISKEFTDFLAKRMEAIDPSWSYEAEKKNLTEESQLSVRCYPYSANSPEEAMNEYDLEEQANNCHDYFCDDLWDIIMMEALTMEEGSALVEKLDELWNKM